MRWAGLFADLQAQAEALERSERAGEVDERTRAELGELRLRDRLRAGIDGPVRLRCAGGVAVAGTLTRVGPDWLLVAEEVGRECIVPLASVLAVSRPGRLACDPVGESKVEARLGLRSALRAVARDRSGLRLYLVDGAVLSATLDRVGADFVEAAIHPAGEARRPSAVQEVQLIAFTALAAVRREV